MTIRRLGLIALATGMAFGQAPAIPSPAGRPEFEVASIKPSAPGAIDQVRVGLHLDGSQVSCTSLTLKEYMAIAYRVKRYQISGPDWIGSDRFDINAKLPAGSSGKQIPEMLQTLLEDRFQMKMHRETRDLPVYGLVLGKGGLKMQESPPDTSADAHSGQEGVNVAASGEAKGVSINYGNGAYFTFADNQLTGKKLSAPLMAEVLARFTDRPVVDMTNLKSKYDFVLELTPEDFRAMMIRSAVAAGIALRPRALQYAEANSEDSLFDAVEKLGLKLESRKAPLEVLVIDQAEKTPEEN